ncbi:MAG: peptide chain release factor 1 [Planctomycetes bacterium]|nr:peptide chain release factor 1 [Planctomycetota bacterium]
MEAPIEGTLRGRLSEIVTRHGELETTLAAPESQLDRARYQELLKEHGAKATLVGYCKEYIALESDLLEARRMAAGSDAELRELAAAELEPLAERLAASARRIREFILDSQIDGADANAIVEIRAGTGGDEAALFAADVFKMYSLYADSQRWKLEVLSASDTSLGGYKDITFQVNGRGVYARLRFESGGHRVQRVPATETQGRIHTSAITVAVMQEVEEAEVAIHEKDLRVDTYCASGPGGQKVNKTASAVRITHIPTGIVVAIQDEKSQHKNRAKALKVLRSRIREAELRERREKEDALRRSLIGSGDRSDRIRTYNFPQNRVTDHRINVSIYALDRFMLGDIGGLLDQLAARDREERVQML